MLSSESPCLGTGKIDILNADGSRSHYGSYGGPEAEGGDEDGDGVGPMGGDCDDGDALAAPGLEEVAGDARDNDCAGGAELDIDEDGYLYPLDRDDEDPVPGQRTSPVTASTPTAMDWTAKSRIRQWGGHRCPGSMDMGRASMKMMPTVTATATTTATPTPMTATAHPTVPTTTATKRMMAAAVRPARRPAVQLGSRSCSSASWSDGGRSYR